MESRSSSHGDFSSVSAPGDPSLSVALTLISTEAGGFQVDDVAPVAVTAALDFLSSPAQSELSGLRVVLAAEEGSPALEALREHVPKLAEARGERRLITKACMLPDVSKTGTPCAFIINPCNWRLIGSGARTNVLVNLAAGECLRKASLNGRSRANVAEPIAVKLPPESPLRAQGVDTIIQLLGPNLDPQFPGCMADKPDEALRLLRLCYVNAFACFWGLVTTLPCSVARGKGAGMAVGTTDADSTMKGASGGTGVPSGAEKVLSQGGGDAARRKGGAAASQGKNGGKGREGKRVWSRGHNNKDPENQPPLPHSSSPPATNAAAAAADDDDDAVSTPDIGRPDTFPTYNEQLAVPVTKPGRVGGGGHSNYKRVLYEFFKQPRSADIQRGIYLEVEDKKIVAVYDGFAKSRRHLLLIAKPSFLHVKTPSDLRKEHLPALRRLHAWGAAIAEALSYQGGGVIRCGYHAIPSLELLHLHIISQDFVGARLRKKSHWNSFTTEFFLETSWVEARLEELGSLELDMTMYKRLESQPLQCFRCGQGLRNMPSLKAHNLACGA